MKFIHAGRNYINIENCERVCFINDGHESSMYVKIWLRGGSQHEIVGEDAYEFKSAWLGVMELLDTCDKAEQT